MFLYMQDPAGNELTHHGSSLAFLIAARMSLGQIAFMAH